MAPLKFLSLGLMVLVFSLSFNVQAQLVDHETSLNLMTDAMEMEWPLSMSAYDGSSFDEEEEEDIHGSDVEESEYGRRSLFWHGMKYYISYGALSANRIPCPPRSGRSYYTHNCYKARGPVHPYTRGCAAITRCRR